MWISQYGVCKYSINDGNDVLQLTPLLLSKISAKVLLPIQRGLPISTLPQPNPIARVVTATVTIEKNS